MLKVIIVCGARPNFMKIAPICAAIERTPGMTAILVHTGQHYDERMSALFFDELAIPAPDVNLGVGSGSHAIQTAEIMARFEPVCLEHRPDWVLVVGDVNSTAACALVATKLGIRVAHVEAGLRSFDRSMPEEINRVVTDAVSDLHFVTEPSGVENLAGEGVARDRIHLVGNVMIDTLLAHRDRAEQSTILQELGLNEQGYAVVTLHRPANVDDPARLSGILDAVDRIGRDMPVLMPVHPRTRESVNRLGLAARLDASPCIRTTPPLGYIDFLKAMASAAVVLTDSGGIQEETTILGVPCLTLRPNTERPITITNGTNRLTGTLAADIVAAYEAVRAAPPTGRIPPLWDGKAAERIVRILARPPGLRDGRANADARSTADFAQSPEPGEVQLPGAPARPVAAAGPSTAGPSTVGQRPVGQRPVGHSLDQA